MADNKNPEIKKIQLEENEIMRLSVRKVDDDDDKYEVCFESKGNSAPMVQALMQICDEAFDMVCIPKEVLKMAAGIAICIGNPFATDGEQNKE